MVISVKLDKWATPLTIHGAVTVEQAKRMALEQYPVCDCGCGEATKVEKVVVSG